jgi:hypothetical protein
MKLEDRIAAFSYLGEILRDALNGKQTDFTSRLAQLIEGQQAKNPWFTPENVRMAVNSIANELTADNLNKWCSSYPQLKEELQPFTAGVIMAGNIPLVGFHDFIAVLITGNNIIAKTSSKDKDLIVFVSDVLCKAEQEFSGRITITEGTISGFDAVIATGSDNSSRYFEYYFGKYHHIIRKNRNSIAKIDGSETDYELKALGTDIFSYFGLGCRNVAKIYVPEGYDLKKMISCWGSFSGIINHNKYANNFDYHKAVFLVNKEKFLDTGYLLLKEHNGLSSPVAVLYYEYYGTKDKLNQRIQHIRDKIQCIVGHNEVPFGKAQMPALWDYADGIDTIGFLLKKNSMGIL